jgi:uncharacterized protein (DUF433 family)
MDWTRCDLIEIVPGKMSGAPVIKGTRVTPETVVINRELGDEEIAYQFSLPVETVRQVLSYWNAHRATLVA